MSFEKLANGIPLHEAASFFLKLKTAGQDLSAQQQGQTPPVVEGEPEGAPDTGYSETPKIAAAGARVERFLPGTFEYHGSAMKLALATMSPTVFLAPPEDEKTAAVGPRAADLIQELKNTPSHADALMKFQRKSKSLMTHAVAGTAGLVAGSALEAHARKKEKSAGAELPDAAMGKMPAATPPSPLTGAATGQVPKMAAAMKRAFDEMPAAANPVPGGKEDGELQNYLATEGQAMQGQNEAEDGYYRQRFTDAMTRLQSAEEAQQAAEAQVQQLTEQVSQGATQNQEALAQAQQIQQAAMQQVNAANSAAAGAMSQSLASSNEVLQQQQLAVQMRDAMQGLKQQLMGIVQTQLPPSTTQEAGVSAQSDQAQADNAAQEQAMQAGQDPSGNQAGTPAASGDAGTPPGSATPGANGPGQSPTASDGGSGSAAPAGATTQSTTTPPDAGGTEEPAKQASDRFVGALMGGALGAGGNAIQSQMSNDPLRDKVKKLESAESAGQGGFGSALDLAQARMRLAMGEFGEKHPVAYSALGGAMGAAAGAQAGPHVRDIATAIRG